jgi:hypothetical protein
MIKTVMSEVTRLYDQRSYRRVTSDMTVVIIGTWGMSYKRVTSDITVVIIGTWGRSYKCVASDTTVYMTYPTF